MNKWKIIFLVLLSLFHYGWLEATSLGQKNLLYSNSSINFSLTSRRNQTGHHIIYLSVDKSAIELPNTWKIDLKNSFTVNNGLGSVHLQGIFTVSPPIPDDYELFHGIGYYKFHKEAASSFDDASTTCLKEGGHLTIINSKAESHVLQAIWRRYPETESYKYIYAFVGIHDRLKEGEFLTIFGQPLILTDFTTWAGSNPDNYGNNEDCGSVDRGGRLNDVSCEAKLPFFCEYDLSWSES